MRDERSEGLQGGAGDSVPSNLLDSFDRVIASLPPGDPIRRELLDLRPDIFDQQETMIEARRMIEKLEEVVKKVTSPANRIGTFLGERSVRDRGRSRIRNGWPSDQNYRDPRQGSIARRVRTRIAFHGAAALCRPY